MAKTNYKKLTSGDIELIMQSTLHTDEVTWALNNAFTRALAKIGLMAENYAKRLCPVDTGRLRNSIAHDIDASNAYIGTNVEYAPYVENGTSRSKPHPYLKPAATEHAEDYKKVLQKAVDEASGK